MKDSKCTQIKSKIILKCFTKYQIVHQGARLAANSEPEKLVIDEQQPQGGGDLTMRNIEAEMGQERREGGEEEEEKGERSNKLESHLMEKAAGEEEEEELKAEEGELEVS